MKKLFYFLGIIMIPNLTSAQLQNLDFENWESPITWQGLNPNNPNGWRSCNRWFGTEHGNFAFVFQNPVDTNAQQNNYAINLNVWYHSSKDAAYQSATIDYKPAALKGFYKYQGNEFIDGTVKMIDTAQVVVLLSKWNVALEKTDTVGLGIFSTAAATAVYQEFNAAIQYFTDEMPEKITILLDPSIIGRYYDRNYSSAEEKCSWFTVDNLSLINGTTGLNEFTTQQSLSVYPNPASGSIHFENTSGNAVIYDVSGKQVINVTLKNESSIDVKDLSSGTYFLQIKGGNKGINYSKFSKL